MIPKVIHYCWFGNKLKPKLVLDCLKSWEKHLPDYEIIEWNEKNSDLNHPFVKESYRLKKWAFVSDYIRLQKLYEFGGIYLDTDMLVLKPFNDLLNNKCFFGAEDENYISCGIIGVEKNNKIIYELLTQYDSIKIYSNNTWESITMPVLITRQLRHFFNFSEDFGSRINFKDVVIYETDFFYPLPNKFKEDNINYINYLTPNTIAVHLWSASWVEHDEYYYIQKRLFFKAICQIAKTIFIKKNFNKKNFKKILKEFYKAIRKH